MEQENEIIVTRTNYMILKIFAVVFSIHVFISWTFLYRISVTTQVNQNILNSLATELDTMYLLLKEPFWRSSTRYPTKPVVTTTNAPSTTEGNPSSTTAGVITPNFTSTTLGSSVNTTDFPVSTTEDNSFSTSYKITTTNFKPTTTGVPEEVTTDLISTEDYIPVTFVSTSSTRSSSQTTMFTSTMKSNISTSTHSYESLDPVSLLNNQFGKKIYNCIKICVKPIIFKGELLHKNTTFEAYGLMDMTFAKKSVAYEALKKLYSDKAGKVKPHLNWLTDKPTCTATSAPSLIYSNEKNGCKK